MPLFLLLTACSGLSDASAGALESEPRVPAVELPTAPTPPVAVAIAVDWVSLDKDNGEGKFEGTAVSQAVFTKALADTGQELVFFIHG